MTKEEEARKYKQMLAAALLLSDRAVWYDAELDGTPMLLLGYRENGRDIVPLAAMINDDLFDRINVDATKLRDGRVV